MLPLLGEQSLLFEKRTKSFASPGDLTKHFKRMHLANIKEEDRIARSVECLCSISRISEIMQSASTRQFRDPSVLNEKRTAT